MNYRITIGLLIVVAVLGGVVYGLNPQPPTPTPAGGSSPLFSFLSVDVSELSATSAGKGTVATRAEDGSWTLQQPAVAPADRIRLDSLVARLSSLSSTRKFENADLSEYGLATPRAEMRVKARAGQEYVLLIGNDTPDKSGTYAKLPSDATVYVVGGGIGADAVRLVTDPPKATPTPTVIVPNLTPLPTAAAPGVPGSQVSPTAILPQVLPPTAPPATPAAASTPAPVATAKP